jgi:hypothetical protein
MNKQELIERAARYSVDLKGNEITECHIDGAIIAACIMRDEHPCVGCNIDACKHNYTENDKG